MSKPKLIYILVIPAFSISSTAFAFDPFTIAFTSDAAQNIFGKVSDTAETGFAINDLLSELGIDEDSGKDLEQAMDNLNKINSDANALKGNSLDLHDTVTNDIANGQSLTSRIRAVKNAVRISKQIATLMGIRPKAGDVAVKIESMGQNAMILNELQAIRKAQYVAYIEGHQAKLTRDVYIQQIIDKSNQEVKQ